MSSGQWEALPQRTRRRRTAASTPPGKGPGSPPRPPQPRAATAASASSSSPPAPPMAAAAAAGRTDVAEKATRPARTESLPRAGDGDRQQARHQQQRLASSSRISCADASEPPAQNPREDGGVEATTSCGERQQGESPHGNPSSVGRGGGRPPLGSSTTSPGDKRIGEGGGERGAIRKGGAADAATILARHAAVATAVDARSKMARFSEGLGGGAGADGGADGEANFEYLDHTADVQLHSWGDSIERAMEGALAAMFNTITDIAKVDIDPSLTKSLDIEGHDAKSLLFSLLDEFLFLFHSEGLVVKKATINGMVDRADGNRGGGNDGGQGGGDGSGGDDRTPSARWRIRATAEGETFDLAKHPQGTEVKAITYSNMQINEVLGGRTDIYVIVDI